MGHNIKVGDKVRLTGADWYGYDDGVTVGTIVEVTNIDEDGIFAGDADSVGNEKGLYSEENPYALAVGDYSVELVTPKTRFDVGDEVYDASSANFGLGRITDVREGYYRVRFYYAEDNGHYSSQGDAHTRKEDEVTQDCVEEDCVCRDKERPNPLAGRESPNEEMAEAWSKFVQGNPTNAVDPDHYKFPNGAEVIQISQWLTANIAQASQYLARSSRIDGKNKGDTLEDLEKAKVFIDFEIARLKGQK